MKAYLTCKAVIPFKLSMQIKQAGIDFNGYITFAP